MADKELVEMRGETHLARITNTETFFCFWRRNEAPPYRGVGVQGKNRAQRVDSMSGSVLSSALWGEAATLMPIITENNQKSHGLRGARPD